MTLISEKIKINIFLKIRTNKGKPVRDEKRGSEICKLESRRTMARVQILLSVTARQHLRLKLHGCNSEQSVLPDLLLIYITSQGSISTSGTNIILSTCNSCIFFCVAAEEGGCCKHAVHFQKHIATPPSFTRQGLP